MQVSDLRRKQHFRVPVLDGKQGQLLDIYPDDAGVIVRWRVWREPRSFERRGKTVTIKGGWIWGQPQWITAGLEVTNGKGAQ